MDQIEHKPLSYEFKNLIDSRQTESITFEDLVKNLGGRGYALLNIFIIIPFLQPIPLPILSTIFGIVLALNGIMMIFSRKIWLPKKIKSKRIPKETIDKISIAALKIFSKLEKVVRPRLKIVASNPVTAVINGVIISVCGLAIIPPLPIPLTNFVPGIIVFLVSVASLEEDGLFLILGYAIFFSTCALLFIYFPELIIRLIPT